MTNDTTGRLEQLTEEDVREIVGEIKSKIRSGTEKIKSMFGIINNSILEKDKIEWVAHDSLFHSEDGADYRVEWELENARKIYLGQGYGIDSVKRKIQDFKKLKNTTLPQKMCGTGIEFILGGMTKLLGRERKKSIAKYEATIRKIYDEMGKPELQYPRIRIMYEIQGKDKVLEWYIEHTGVKPKK